jgi:hypothetical protein
MAAKGRSCAFHAAVHEAALQRKDTGPGITENRQGPAINGRLEGRAL